MYHGPAKPVQPVNDRLQSGPVEPAPGARERRQGVPWPASAYRRPSNMVCKPQCSGRIPPLPMHWQALVMSTLDLNALFVRPGRPGRGRV